MGGEWMDGGFVDIGKNVILSESSFKRLMKLNFNENSEMHVL